MASSPPDTGRLSLTWVGHSTVVLDLDGVRFLTDPLLRSHVAHLRRVQPVDLGPVEGIDAVLVSHGHYDHLDVPSLRKLDVSIPVFAPRGATSVLRRAGRLAVEELGVGDRRDVGGVTLEATPAEHEGGGGLRKSEALGFILRGSASVYFAGDTDLFPEMEELGPVDVALLPVWGWGPTLGTGHLDPERAARAAALLRPRVVVPIHWGTYYPVHQRRGDYLERPPLDFRAALTEAAPGSRVEILQLGATAQLSGARSRA
jgi:L-ascorbate metabolism protein UlaG (beta-lactamase superfamily)